VEKWVRLWLIGGLNDEDTMQEVLSKVEEMPLDTTITFIEARETGKTATKILGGKLTSSIVNQVQKLRHEVWDKREGRYIKSELPDEPKLKIRMCVDILAYRSHQPYVQLSVREDWYANLGPNRQ
jgi:hypothetical protein